MVYRFIDLRIGGFVDICKQPMVDRHLSNLVSKVLKRYSRLKIQDFAKLLHLAGNYQITELQIDSGDWLAGRTLAELGLRKEGIIVLGITRAGGRYVGAPDGETTINPNDVLVIYGRAEVMIDLDQRKGGFSGNLAHQQNIDDQRKRRTIHKLHHWQFSSVCMDAVSWHPDERTATCFHWTSFNWIGNWWSTT